MCVALPSLKTRFYFIVILFILQAIVTETTRRVQRMTQVHIHRRNGEGSGAGGSSTGVRDTRNGAYEAQMLVRAI